MAGFILSKPLLVLLLIIIPLFSKISILDATFFFTSTNKNTSFESEDFALYGDAKLIGSSIQLTNGRVLYRKPIESMKNRYSQIFDGFSTVFSFSLFPNDVGKLGFVLFPVVNKTSLFEVRFETIDSNIMVIVDGATVPEKSEKILQDFTITKLEKVLLYAWINYEAGRKVLEVQLSKSKSFGDSLIPLRFKQIEMLEDELNKFMVGLNSYGGKVNLHSWSLNVRHFEHSTAALEFARKEAERKRRREKMDEMRA